MKSNTKHTFACYFKHAKKYKWAGITVVIFVLLASLLSALVPLYYKEFFDTLAGMSSGGRDSGALIAILMKVLAAGIVIGTCWRIAEYTNIGFQTKTITDLEETSFEVLHRHGVSFFHNSFVGSLVKKVNKFVWGFERIADTFTWDLSPIVVEVATIIVVLSLQQPLLGAIIALWVVIFISFNYFFSKFKLKHDMERSALGTKVVGQLADSVTNQENIKLFASFGREKTRFRELLNLWRDKMQFTWGLSNIFHGVQDALMLSLEIGIMVYAVHLWKHGHLTVGDLVLIQTYLATLFVKLFGFGRLIRNFYEQIAEAEEMTVIMQTPYQIVDRPGAEPLVVQKPTVEFRDVNFCYNQTRTVIPNLNLKIAAGERVGLVGPSGAGKSTIIKLLLRLYDATSGKILIDGQRINHVTQESLHEAVALVPQDPVLFHRSLMENIRYGRPSATDEEVIEAAKHANCHDFIVNSPEGYETLVGERGVKLSGGERQRIAIARAFLRAAPILILDEATSSLDSHSEEQIQEALKRLMSGRTVVSIAHRLSTVMSMDRIVVLKGGEIAEEGSHTALLNEKNGIYKMLWDLQAGGFVDDITA